MSKEAKRRVLKWVAVAAVVPSVFLFVMVALFVARSELAHDDATCRFTETESRQVAPDVALVDEARRCQPGVEEHRWIVVRAGGRREIGRRRLAQEAYAPGRYALEATVEDGFVHVHITNQGIEDARFREGPE